MGGDRPSQVAPHEVRTKNIGTAPGSGTVDGKTKFSPVVNNGKGNVPGVSWGSSEHTNELIPLFAKGAAAAWLRDYAQIKDPIYGPYVDNTDVAHLIRQKPEVVPLSSPEPSLGPSLAHRRPPGRLFNEIVTNPQHLLNIGPLLSR